MRPRRLAGAAAAVGVAAFAALALLLPDSTPADAPRAQAVPVASVMPPADAGPRFDVRATAAPDDPVPFTSAGKAAGGGCSHDL